MRAARLGRVLVLDEADKAPLEVRNAFTPPPFVFYSVEHVGGGCFDLKPYINPLS